MSVSPLVYQIWSRGLGEQSEVVAEITKAALNVLYTAVIRPQAGFENSIVHRVTLALPMPQDAGKAIAVVGSVAITTTAYSTVASWTIADNYSGSLKEVSVDSTNMAKTNWRLTIAGEQQFAGFNPFNGFTLPFPQNQIPEDAVVLLEAASTDGTAITAYGTITGKLYPPYVFEIRPRKGGNVTPHVGYSTADIIRDGVYTWAYISNSDPLFIDVINRYGFGNEHFLAYAWMINVPSKAHLKEIQRLAEQFGVRETLPFGIPELVRR